MGPFSRAARRVGGAGRRSFSLAQQAGAGGRNCEERGARGAGQGRAPAERPSVIPD